jgi:hypothetical protein
VFGFIMPREFTTPPEYSMSPDIKDERNDLAEYLDPINEEGK